MFTGGVTFVTRGRSIRAEARYTVVVPLALPAARLCRGLLLLVAAGVGVACEHAVTPDRPTGARSLRVAILDDERTLNPYTYVSGYPGWNMLMLVYDTLFQLDRDNVPQPWVAREHTGTADGLAHTLALRDDVRWHDGRPLTSADVKFSFEFYRVHPHGRWSVAVRGIAGIDTPDPCTVVIVLQAPDPSFATRLLADVPILPAHVWSGVADPRTADLRVGSGPFRLTEYRSDELYRFTANPAHFAGAPAVDEIVMPIVKDPGTLFSALEAGDVHATTEPLPPELVARFTDRPGFGVAHGPGFATTLLQFNTERASWHDTRIRQAVALAIDTERLVETLLLGHGTAGNPGWLHPRLPAHDPSVRPTFDPSASARLLDDAGAVDRDGDGVREYRGAPLSPILLVQANQPMRLRAAELIAASVRAIGIDARVRAEEQASLTAKVWPDFDVARGRNFDWAIFGWAPPVMVDPLRMAALVDSDVRYGANNIGGFENAEADRLSRLLRSTMDPVGQLTALRQLEALIAHERPFVLLWYADLVFAYRTATFDGWLFQSGQGIFHKRSFAGAP
jgi:peptide/nickel transport system substrate-binding protein